MEDNLISITDASKFLRIAQSTLRNRVNTGKLKAKKVKSEWYVGLEELQKHYYILSADQNWQIALKVWRSPRDLGWCASADAFRQVAEGIKIQPSDIQVDVDPLRAMNRAVQWTANKLGIDIRVHEGEDENARS